MQFLMIFEIFRLQLGWYVAPAECTEFPKLEGGTYAPKVATPLFIIGLLGLSVCTSCRHEVENFKLE